MLLTAQFKAPEEPIWGTLPSVHAKEIPCVGLDGDRWFRPISLQGDWVEFTGSVMAIDPSGKGKDETSYAVVKMLNGYLYVTACGGFQGGYGPSVLNNLAAIAKKEKVNHIIVEANFGGGIGLLPKIRSRCYESFE